MPGTPEPPEHTRNGSATDTHFVTVDTYICERGPCNGQICP